MVVPVSILPPIPLQTLLKSETCAGGLAAVDYYFIQEDGGMFKATVAFEPYFYVVCKVRPMLIVAAPPDPITCSLEPKA